MQSAWVSEIFDSIQGEGIYAGVRQIFIRFSGCNLRCGYCDTPESRRLHKYCLVSRLNGGSPKGRQRSKLKNPLSVSDVTSVLEKFLPSNQKRATSNRFYHSVSLTGGEPLLHADFIKKLAPAVKKLGLKTYLETNGSLPGELKKVIRHIDLVSMDIKLPSATGKRIWKEHREFLKISGNKVFVKIAVDKNALPGEIEKASMLIADINKDIPLIFQPAGRAKNLLKYQELACRYLADVRIIPQIHKKMGFN